MRSSSIPRSLIIIASAALTFGACGETSTDGTGMTGGPATGAAGAPSSGGAAGGGTTPGAGAAGKPAGAAGTPAAVSGTAGSGTATGAAGTPATGAAGGGAAGTPAAGAAGGGAAGGGAAAGGPVTFTQVHEMILVGTGCSVGACHGSAMAPSRLGLADKMEAYTGLVGTKAMGNAGPMPGGGCAGMDFERVKAGDPAASLLVQKLEKTQTCGKEMPIGGMLKPEQIKMVRDWITAGAKND
jgi:hypothetical protein